jgi:hypothetical protein
MHKFVCYYFYYPVVVIACWYVKWVFLKLYILTCIKFEFLKRTKLKFIVNLENIIWMPDEYFGT